jgi:hypothetical protein
VKIEEFAPISPARLNRMRWKGKRSYRVLSYSFSLRWNGELTGDQVHYVFGSFAVSRRKGVLGDSAIHNGASLYSLLDLGAREPRRYRLLLGDQQLISSRNPEDVLNHLLHQIFTRMQDHPDESILIHAGSVVTPRGEGVLLPGNPGSGKTTLVAGLIRAGFGFLSDEIGIIDPRTGVLHPYPRALNFKEGTLSILPDLPQPTIASLPPSSPRYVRAEEFRRDVMADPCEVRFVIAPRYLEGSAAQVTPLSPAATVKELWANALHTPRSGPQALSILVDVARRARGYRLVSGDLEEAVQAINELTGPSRAGP